MISLLHALSSYFRDTTLEGAAGLIISALRLRLRAGAGAENYLEIIHYRRPEGCAVPRFVRQLGVCSGILRPVFA
jgi:hypothetical protein